MRLLLFFFSLPFLLTAACRDKQADDSASGSDTGTEAGTYDGDLFLATEQEMDSFCEDFKVVGGDLTITTEGVENLQALSCLEEVQGDLEITGDDLSEVSLPELVTVWGDLKIADAVALEVVSLDALMSVGGGLTLASNPMMTTASLVDLCDCSILLVIRENPSLVDLKLPSLQWVGAPISSFAPGPTAEVGLEISGTESLEVLGLGRLESVAGVLSITGNAGLTTLDLDSLQVVTDQILIQENPVLEVMAVDSLGQWIGDLDLSDIPALLEADFPSLLEISGSLTVADHSSLQVFSAPYVGKILADMEITWEGVDTSPLTSVDLAAMDEVVGSVRVTGHAQLGSLILDNLQTVGGAFSVTENASLSELGLANLESVVAEFELGTLPYLPIEVLANVQSVGGTLLLSQLGSEDNKTDDVALSALTDLGGHLQISEVRGKALYVDLLVTLPGSLHISSNPDLETLSMETIESIEESFVVDGNDALLTLSGFEQLTDVGGPLEFRDNARLQDIGNLAGLQSVGEDETCAHQLLICGSGEDYTESVELEAILAGFCDLASGLITGGVLADENSYVYPNFLDGGGNVECSADSACPDTLYLATDTCSGG